MDILRRNTDYALRAMLNLAKQWSTEPISARKMAREEKIPYQIMCKLLQKLHEVGLVISYMGPRGWYRLSREPSKISLLEVVRAIQGPVRINKCLAGVDGCPFRPKCAMSGTLIELENYIGNYLRETTLDKLLTSLDTKEGRKVSQQRKTMSGT